MSTIACNVAVSACKKGGGRTLSGWDSEFECTHAELFTYGAAIVSRVGTVAPNGAIQLVRTLPSASARLRFSVQSVCPPQSPKITPGVQDGVFFPSPRFRC